MKKLVLFTLCLLALFCALRAAGACKPAEQTPEMRTLIFTTWPTGAKVFVHDEEKGLREIGVSGKPIELDLNTLPEKGDFTVLFKLDGFGDREEKIPVVFFRKNARYPSTGTLRLKALSPSPTSSTS